MKCQPAENISINSTAQLSILRRSLFVLIRHNYSMEALPRMRLEPFSDGQKRFWQKMSFESSRSEHGKVGCYWSSTVRHTMSVFRNIRRGFKFSALEICSLLHSPTEILLYIDCRLRNVGTKIFKYWKSTQIPLFHKKLWRNAFFLMAVWKPGFSSKIPPNLKPSGRKGKKKEESFN